MTTAPPTAPVIEPRVSALRWYHDPPVPPAEALQRPLILAPVGKGTGQPESAYPAAAADAGDDHHALRTDTNLTDLGCAHSFSNIGSYPAVLNLATRPVGKASVLLQVPT